MVPYNLTAQAHQCDFQHRTHLFGTVEIKLSLSDVVCGSFIRLYLLSSRSYCDCEERNMSTVTTVSVNVKKKTKSLSCLELNNFSKEVDILLIFIPLG